MARRRRDRNMKRYTLTNTPNTPQVEMETTMSEVPHINLPMFSKTPLNSPLAAEIDALKGRVVALEARLEVLESGEPVKVVVKDELGEKILALLKPYPNLKFNAGSVASNIGERTDRVSGKLRSMVGRGQLKSEKEEGLSAQFWFEGESE